MGAKAQTRALKLLKEASKKRATLGKDPAGLAAAALYIASILEGEQITQREMAKAAEVTEVTVRNRYKGLKRALKLKI